MTLLTLLGSGPADAPAVEYELTTTFGDALYERLSPVAAPDEGLGWPLRGLCRAIGIMFEEVEQAARTSDAAPGWGPVLAADAAPAKWLGWLAQLGGVRRIAGLSDDEFRDRIKRADGWRRGTPASMIAAAQVHLAGTKRVTFRERDGDPYAVTVITYTAETPDPAAAAAAILEQKPAGLVLTCTVLDGWDYTEMAGDYTGQDYDALAGDFASYDDLNAKDI